MFYQYNAELLSPMYFLSKPRSAQSFTSILILCYVTFSFFAIYGRLRMRNSFSSLFYSKSQSLTPIMYMTKEYFDTSLYMGGKIRSQSIKFANLKKFYFKSLIYFYFAIYHQYYKPTAQSDPRV